MKKLILLLLFFISNANVYCQSNDESTIINALIDKNLYLYGNSSKIFNQNFFEVKEKINIAEFQIERLKKTYQAEIEAAERVVKNKTQFYSDDAMNQTAAINQKREIELLGMQKNIRDYKFAAKQDFLEKRENLLNPLKGMLDRDRIISNAESDLTLLEYYRVIYPDGGKINNVEFFINNIKEKTSFFLKKYFLTDSAILIEILEPIPMEESKLLLNKNPNALVSYIFPDESSTNFSIIVNDIPNQYKVDFNKMDDIEILRKMSEESNIRKEDMEAKLLDFSTTYINGRFFSKEVKKMTLNSYSNPYYFTFIEYKCVVNNSIITFTVTARESEFKLINEFYNELVNSIKIW